MQRHRSQRTSRKDKSVCRRHGICGILCPAAHESMAGHSGLLPRSPVRICILQDRLTETDHAHALHQQHTGRHIKQDSPVQGCRDIHGHPQSVGILVHICSMHGDSLLLCGNRTELFEEGAVIRELRNISFFQYVRFSHIPIDTLVQSRVKSGEQAPYAYIF